jgi:hypothetical protein
MATLRQDTRGNFSARKRLPDDVREEYGRRFGQRLEAKFSAPAKVGAHAARQMFRDWETEVAGRIMANPRIDPEGLHTGRAHLILGLFYKIKKKRALALQHLIEAKRIFSQFGQTPILARAETALAELGQ